MFDLYGIYDTSEIMIIVLVIIIIILIIVIVILYFSPIKKEIVKIEKDIEEEIDEIIEPEKPKKIKATKEKQNHSKKTFLIFNLSLLVFGFLNLFASLVANCSFQYKFQFTNFFSKIFL